MAEGERKAAWRGGVNGGASSAAALNPRHQQYSGEKRSNG
jgi:hypothetical protein